MLSQHIQHRKYYQLIVIHVIFPTPRTVPQSESRNSSNNNLSHKQQLCVVMFARRASSELWRDKSIAKHPILTYQRSSKTDSPWARLTKLTEPRNAILHCKTSKHPQIQSQTSRIIAHEYHTISC